MALAARNLHDPAEDQVADRYLVWGPHRVAIFTDDGMHEAMMSLMCRDLSRERPVQLPVQRRSDPDPWVFLGTLNLITGELEETRCMAC